MPTARATRLGARGSHALEELRLLRLEFLRTDEPAIAQVCEFANLIRNVRRWRCGRRVGDHGRRTGGPRGALASERFHLAVDLLLHAVRMPHVLELRRAVRARGLDLQITGADQPLPDPLVE